VPYVFTGANGDKLAVYYGNTAQGATSPGTFQLYPADSGKFYAVFLAQFVPKVSECTGRFARIESSKAFCHEIAAAAGVDCPSPDSIVIPAGHTTLPR